MTVQMLKAFGVRKKKTLIGVSPSNSQVHVVDDSHFRQKYVFCLLKKHIRVERVPLTGSWNL